MTDNEIIKALECCIAKRNQYCFSCSFSKETNCTLKMLEKTLDLINRQKAEIEQLRLENRVLSQNRKIS